MNTFFLSQKGKLAAILIAILTLSLVNVTALLAQNEDLRQFYAALTILLVFEHEAEKLIQSLDEDMTPDQIAEFEGLLERFEILYSATTEALHELDVSIYYREAFDKLALASNCMRSFMNNLRRLFATSSTLEVKKYIQKSAEEFLLYKKNLIEAVGLLPQIPVYDARFSGIKFEPNDSRVVYLALTLYDSEGNVINTNIDRDDYLVYFDNNSVIGTVEDVYSNPSIEDATRIILLLIDSSGSMEKTDPYRKRVDAACKIVDLLGENDYVIVGEFGNSKIPPFMNVLGIGSGLQKIELKECIQQVGQNGSHTPLYASISEGIVVMSNLNEKIQQKYGGSLLSNYIESCIIVLTDGDEYFKPDRSMMNTKTTVIYQEILSKPEFVILASQKSATPVYTIGLSQDVDTSTLNRIAHNTDGLFGETASADGLDAIYNQFSTALQGQTVLKVRLNKSIYDIHNLSFRVRLSEQISSSRLVNVQGRLR